MILIVDYRPDGQLSLKKLIESWGYSTDIVYSDNEILKKVLKKHYTLIIINVKSIDSNSFKIAKALINSNINNVAPIIFLSETGVEKEGLLKMYQLGTIDYLIKPIDSHALFLKIKILNRLYEQGLELRRAEQKLQQEIISRRQAQIELKDRIKYLHSILQSLPQITFKADYNGTITFVNNKWFEYSKSSLVFPQQDPKMESIQQKFKECRIHNNSLEYEVRIKHLKSDVYRYHLLRITPIKENDIIKKWIGTFTDIEEQKQIEYKKEEFLSIASHELKTPLTSIKGYVQLLSRLSSSMDNKLMIGLVEKTHNQVISLEMLISDLLDFTRINNDKFNMNFTYFDLKRLINDVIFTFNQLNNMLKIKIVREGVEFKSAVYGDVHKIEQVLVNYLTNASKYAPGSDKIIVRTSYDDDNVKVEVIDFGIGIPKEKQDKLFTKFYRVEDNSVSFQGLGIGLFICSQIINQHNGSYGLNSLVGTGSQFYFTLPIA